MLTKSTPPASLTLVDGRSVALWSWNQLSNLNRQNLKRRALDLHTVAGPELSPQLKTGLPPHELARWIIDLQISLAAAAGTPLSPADFGVEEKDHTAVRFPEELRKKPFEPWSLEPTTETQFRYDEAYIQAAVVAKTENAANRSMHRGTLDQFLFSGGDPIEPKDPHYRVTPPFQVQTASGRRPNTATGKASIAATSYMVPPAHAYNKGSDVWDGSYIGEVNSDVAPALPPLKR